MKSASKRVLDLAVRSIARETALAFSDLPEVVAVAVGVSATVQQSVLGVKDGGTVVWLGNNARVVEVDMQQVVTRELRVLGSYGMTEGDFGQALQLLADGRVPTDKLIHRRAGLEEGPPARRKRSRRGSPKRLGPSCAARLTSCPSAAGLSALPVEVAPVAS